MAVGNWQGTVPGSLALVLVPCAYIQTLAPIGHSGTQACTGPALPLQPASPSGFGVRVPGAVFAVPSPGGTARCLYQCQWPEMCCFSPSPGCPTGCSPLRPAHPTPAPAPTPAPTRISSRLRTTAKVRPREGVASGARGPSGAGGQPCVFPGSSQWPWGAGHLEWRTGRMTWDPQHPPPTQTQTLGWGMGPWKPTLSPRALIC